MKKNDKQTDLRLFQEEADQHLFGHLHFDNELKKRVLERIQDETEAKSLSASDRQGNSSTKWQMITKKWWVFSSIAVSTACLLMVIWAMGDSVKQPVDDGDATILTDDSLGNSPHVGYFPSINGSSKDISLAKANGDGPFDDELAQQWTLNDINEAIDWFSGALRIPSATLDSFTLAEVWAFGDKEGEASRVTFHYASSEDHFYQIEQVVQGSVLDFPKEDKVDINGAEGYLLAKEAKGGKSDVVQMTQLYWQIEGVHYLVTGTISVAKALQIARSL